MLESMGIKDIEVAYNKHCKLIWTHCGRRHMTIVSHTPGDPYRRVHNLRAQVAAAKRSAEEGAAA